MDYVQHNHVFSEYFGFKSLNPPLFCNFNQVLEEKGANSFLLVIVPDYKGDFGHIGGQIEVVTANGNDEIPSLFLYKAGYCHFFIVIGVYQVLQLAVWHSPLGHTQRVNSRAGAG